MRATRLLRLLHLLAARGRMPASELATALDVSTRTIYRDVEALSSAGFPVFAEQGPAGGYELLADFRSPFVVLTPAEVEMLVRLGPPPSAGDLGLGAEVEHAYNKLAVSLTRASARQHRQLVLIDAPRWFSRAGPPSILEQLGRAVAGAQRVRVRRSGRDETLDPLGLVNKAGRWYLVARHDGRHRVLRLDRIDGAEPLAERFEPPAAFDLETFWAAWVLDFESSRGEVDVVVEVSPDGAGELPKALGDRVIELLGEAQPDPAGNRRIRLQFFSVDAAVHHLTGAGHLARVISPESVARAVERRAWAVLARGSGAAPAASAT